jgi:hypothetical protein
MAITQLTPTHTRIIIPKLDELLVPEERTDDDGSYRKRYLVD